MSVFGNVFFIFLGVFTNDFILPPLVVILGPTFAAVEPTFFTFLAVFAVCIVFLIVPAVLEALLISLAMLIPARPVPMVCCTPGNMFAIVSAPAIAAMGAAAALGVA